MFAVARIASAKKCFDRPLMCEPEADDQRNQKRRIEDGKRKNAEPIADSDERSVIYGVFSDQVFSGPHELEEREQTRQYYDRATRDQPYVRGGELFHEYRQDDPRNEDPRHEGYFHE
jgi:hypothetical protein